MDKSKLEYAEFYKAELGSGNYCTKSFGFAVWRHQQVKVDELQKRVDELERKLQIKTRHCEFYEQSRKGHRSLAIHRKKQINSALEQIEKLYSRAESDYQKDRNPYYDGMLSALDLAEQAIRGELEEQALKGEG
ncbi:hypothetical protein ABFP03_06435 [Acinetobacter baumannii]